MTSPVINHKCNDFFKVPLINLIINGKPLGVNSIGRFMSKASTLLNWNVSEKIANHSCRKRSITNMLNSDIHPLFVTQISVSIITTSLLWKHRRKY